MAAPRKEIDYDLLEKYCAIFCTAEEIAFLFDMSADTLDTRIKEKYECGFSEYYKKASSKGKMSLRRKQFEVALSGNVAMLIFLGKNALGQSDKQELSTADNKPIQLAYKLDD